MSEEIDRHVLRRFEICQKLGKGVSSEQLRTCLYSHEVSSGERVNSSENKGLS